MNRFFKVRLITAIMFLIILFAFSIFNICYSGKDTIQEIKNSMAEKSSLKEYGNEALDKYRDLWLFTKING